MTSRSHGLNKAWAVPLFLFLLALGLRLVSVSGKSLWGDEFYAAGLMDKSIGDLVSDSFRGSPHPPLAFVSLKVSAILFGTSEAGLRAVPAVLSALAVLPLYLFLKPRFGTGPSLIAGLLWAVSPYSVSLGQEVWIYGILAASGFTFIWLADLAWNGNRHAALLLVPVGLAGMLVQHLFFLFVAAGFLLYFTIEQLKRVPLKKFLIQAFIMAAVYLPFLFPALQQASLRMERIASAPSSEGVFLQRFLFRVPTVTARLLSGGLAGELSLWNMSSPVTPAIFILSFLAVTAPVVVFISGRRNSSSFRIWTASLFFVPLLLFLREDPTARHLSIMWVPLSIGVAALARSFKPAAIALVLLACLLLVPYYRLDTFPYHRSNWRGAVAHIGQVSQDHQQVVILAGQNGGLAWDYYDETNCHRLAPGGEHPYEVQPTRSDLNPTSVVDSVLASGTEAWVLHDIWGGPQGGDIAPGWPMLSREFFGPHLEVIHFGTR